MNLGSFFWPSTEPPDGIFHANPLSKHFGFTFFAIDPIASRLKKITLIHACFVRGILSRCSKLFYIILSKYFYFALRSCTAFVCPALSHIARYAPLLRQGRLHLSIAHASKLASLCIRFALTLAQNKQLRYNNAIQM